MNTLQQERIFGLLDQLALAWLDARTATTTTTLGAIEKQAQDEDDIFDPKYNVAATGKVEKRAEFKGFDTDPELVLEANNTPTITEGRVNGSKDHQRPADKVPQWRGTRELGGKYYVRYTEVARVLGVSGNYLYSLRNTGLLEARMVRSSYYMPRDQANYLVALANVVPPDRKSVAAWISKNLKARAQA